MLHPLHDSMTMMPSIVNTFEPLAKCVLQFSMQTRQQEQKLIYTDDFVCLLDIPQSMWAMYTIHSLKTYQIIYS